MQDKLIQAIESAISFIDAQMANICDANEAIEHLQMIDRLKQAIEEAKHEHD